MDTQEDLNKKQEEERKQAQQAQDALTKKLADDHRQQNEQMQRQQDQMNETQRRHQESLDQAAQQALEIQSRQRELDQKPVDGQKDPLDAQRERMEKAAEQCHELARQSDEVAKQIQANQEQQQKIAGVLDDQNQPESMRKVATERQEKTLQEAQALQEQHAKLGQEFNAQSKLFDASQNGFSQERDQQTKLLNEAQERLQAETQRRAQEQLDAQNKQSQGELGKIADDLEKRHAETLGAKWKSPEQFDEQGKKLENQQPSGQQFEEQLKKTGELNNRLVEVEQRHDMHNPYQEVGQAGEIEDPGKPKTENIHARSDALSVGLPDEKKGDLDGRRVIRPKVDEKLGEVQDNWASHEKQQRELIKEIRGHEKNAADYGKQLKDSIAEHGDMSKVVPTEYDDVKKITDIKKQQEDLAKMVNKEHQLGERKAGEFKRNETDFQKQSWDRVAKMAELSGDKNLQQKAELKSQELKQKTEIMDQRLDQKYGPKQEAPKQEEQKKFTIKSEGEVNNGIKPVSPAGIPPEMVQKASEQKQEVEKRELARQHDELNPKIKQGGLR